MRMFYGRFVPVLLLSFCITVIRAQSGPSYVIKNTTLNVCNGWLLDTDSLRGKYSAGKTTMTVTSSTGSKLGFQPDSIKLKEDQDYISIYDGPSTSSPLLVTYNRQAVPGSVKTTGSSATIVFNAANSTITTPGFGWRLAVRCINDITKTTDFLPIFQGLRNGNIQLDDYDKDGDKDVLMGGVIYRNDSHEDSLYVFDRILSPIGNWVSSSMVAADFDNDGYKDVFITGQTTDVVNNKKALFYKNNGGTFSPVATSFIPVTSGAISVIDYNNDGKPDIAYTGSITGGAIFKLYINNGNFSFTEVTTNLPGMSNASMSWLDYDKDGDPDLVMNGYNSSGTRTALYINNGNNNFTNANLFMSNTSDGDVAWADVNNDGKADIVNSGVRTGGNVDAIVPEIMLNNGNNTFTRIGTNLPDRYRCHFDWADYDNDGDLDVVLTGGSAGGSTIIEDPAVYKNNGGGNFTKKALVTGGSLSTVKWVDFNKDKKMDLFVTGRRIYPSLFYKNMGSDSFQVASYPSTAYDINGTSLVEDFDNDGWPDVLFAGNTTDQDCNSGYMSVLTKSLGWRLFPTAILTKVADLNINPGGFTYAYPFWRWGDVDNDGKDDILVTNDKPGVLTADPIIIFKNNGGNNFTTMFKGSYPDNLMSNQVGVVDIDNDGRNELYVVPNRIYRWNGSGFTNVYIGPEPNCLNCTSMYYDFADYNKDGLPDLAFCSGDLVYIFKNDGGHLVLTNGGYFLDINDKFLKWFDVDGNGYPDLLTTNGLFENTGWGGLRKRSKDIPRFGQTGIADINNDGWPDVFSLTYRTSIGPSSLFYNQQGSFFFQDKTPPGFINENNGAYEEGAEAFDIDNDGDNDLVYATRSGCTYSGIFLNNFNLRNSYLHLTTPNNGETYSIGSTQKIHWLGNGISSSVNIELSLDSGYTWRTIVSNTNSGPNGGSYDWSINGLPASTKCLVRITDATNQSFTDKSDRTFSIASVTAVQNPLNMDFKFFPNPVGDRLYFQAKPNMQGKKAVVQIFNMEGGLQYTKEFIINSSNDIGFSRFGAGLYLVQLKIGKEMYVHKIIKVQ